MSDGSRRPVEAPFDHDGDIVSFADAFPLLVVNQASLAALGDAVDARRFRPNLVVDGAAAWAEDDWRALRIGARDGDIVSFADGFPVLVVTRASLEALGDGIDVRRFRPNVVVAGAAAWAEDEWRALDVGALTLRTPKPCARCTIPGVDPDSAAITKEPLRTLAKLRTRDNQALFGINAIPDGEGVIRVGDPVVAR